MTIKSILAYGVVILVCVGLFAVVPALSQNNPAVDLPRRGVVIDIDSPEVELYRIAVPNLIGSAVGAQAAEVMRNDFRLISLFRVLDARSFIEDTPSAGLDIKTSDWSAVGAQAVIKGEMRRKGSSTEVEMRLYEIAKGDRPTLSKTYSTSSEGMRKVMHQFANEVVRVLTGQAAHFDSRITFARRQGPGRKDVFVSDYDGHGVSRVSKGRGVAMLPSFGPRGIWYSVLTKMGMFITRSGGNEGPIIKGTGMSMGVTACGNRLYFTSTRTGNAEIFSANTDGSDVRQLTHHRGIDVSPTCGPGGRIAFVSNRHGSPQIFTMNSDGSGLKRVTYRGEYNQTPAWCRDPQKPLIAFTGRGGGDMDVFTVNLRTGEYTRLTQGQGSNKDPAFSPDCRMVAFASSRGGIFVTNPEGLNQNLVVRGAAETVRWSH